MTGSIRVQVTRELIADGVGGDCYRCPVSFAVQSATGDLDANVFDHDSLIHIEVNGLVIRAPQEVQRFVWGYDALPRDEDDRPDPTHPDYEPPEPFAFDLPGQDDPAWQVRCDSCGSLVDRSEVDMDGYCEDCPDSAEFGGEGGEG